MEIIMMMAHLLVAATIFCLQPACVVRVVDGDTMRIEGYRMRLWGVDAPELPSPAGWQARAALKRLVHGQPVRCEPVGRDRYGRTVAKCFIGDIDLGAALIRAGKARPFCRYSGDFYDAAAVEGKRRRCGVSARD